MIFLLDNNVISETWKREPDSNVLAFFESTEWFIPAPVIAEIQEGAEAAGSQARRIEITLRLDNLLKANRVALCWISIAIQPRVWGRLKHSKEAKRQPQALWDSLIDAMAVRYDAIVATRNTSDFRHAKTFNPWLES